MRDAVQRDPAGWVGEDLQDELGGEGASGWRGG